MRRNDKEYTLKKAFRKTPFLKYTPYALKGQKLLAQGNRPGYLWMQACRPVRAEAFKL